MASCVFQFTRPRGARRWRAAREAGTAGFNSRAHAGRDAEISGDCVDVPVVSIHAPTRGATPSRPAICGPPMFQFTRPRGARPESIAARPR